MLSKAKLSILGQLGGLRTYIIIAVALYLVVFNLERLGLQQGAAIGISNATYVLLIGIAITLLAFPNVANASFALLLSAVAVIYIIIDVIPDPTFSPVNYLLGLVTLAITLGVMRSLSSAVLNYEEDTEKLVMDPTNIQVLPYYIGERRVNQEIFRLHRANRPLSIVYCSVVDDEAYPYDLMEITDQTIGKHIDEMYKRRQYQVQLARAIISLAYKSDIIVQHGDALMVCLSEATELEAQRFIERLSIFVASNIKAKLLIGLASFPQEGKNFDDLVHMARGKMRFFGNMGGDTQSQRRRGDVLVDIGQQLEIEQRSEWLNRLAYQSPSAKAIYRPIKRVMDILMCAAVMPAVLPVCAIVALAIYFDDRGPILYHQFRTGYGGKRFRMHKFRTMIVNAPALEPKKVIGEDGTEMYIWPDKDEDDPRITRVGRFLRKTSLDEIPQIFNVVLGDMSVVGPRPTTWDVSMYTPLQIERLTVVPGITGLWQVSARESKNPDERLLWDLKYVEKMGFWLDIQILWRTAMQVVKKGGV